MKANRLIQPSILAVIATLATASSAFAATTLNTGAIFNFVGTNWDNGAPNSSEPGTISANYVVGGSIEVVNANTTVTQIAGTGTGSFFNHYNSSTFIFNLQGGGMNLTQQFLANSGTINVSGGSISTTYFQPTNGGILNLSGGTHTTTSANIFLNGGVMGQLNLTGGTINAAGATSMFSGTAITPTIGIGDAVINASLVTAFGGGGANMDFLTGWTGSLNFSAATDWSAALISSGATLDGIDIDGTNIDNFLISGGSISLIPEPSSALLGGLGVLGLLMRRRRSA